MRSAFPPAPAGKRTMSFMLDLLTTQALAAFMLSLLGGLHCAGMCGGFVGALQLHRPPQVSAARLALGYHVGRLTSYTAACALVGAGGGGGFSGGPLSGRA